jgi:hypothetical protein
MLGIGERTVKKYTPPQSELRNRHPMARIDLNQEPIDNFSDVVPIPFFPPDLPDLRIKPLTAHQLSFVLAEQERILFQVAAA